MPWDVAALLREGWRVDVDETRARIMPGSGGGTGHHHDQVLRATRLGRAPGGSERQMQAQ